MTTSTEPYLMFATARRISRSTSTASRFPAGSLAPFFASNSAILIALFHLVYLIEQAAVVEMHGLRFLPAAKYVVNREQVEFLERGLVTRQHPGIARAEIVPGGQFLPLLGIEILEVRRGELACAALVHHLVHDAGRVLRKHASDG